MTTRRKFLAFILIALVFIAGCGGSGDRVLVAKYLYDGTGQPPQRHDVVVFRYPEQPVKGGVATNYIKRLLGLAGETIAIFLGQLFVTTEVTYDDHLKVPETELRLRQYMHVNDEQPGKAVDLFRQGKFEIIRKPPRTMLAMRRIVYDNDYQAADLRAANFPPRWDTKGSSWQADAEGKVFTHAGGAKADWMHYRHILRPSNWPTDEAAGSPEYKAKVEEILKEKPQPQLITDFLGYNWYMVIVNGRKQVERPDPPNWVGDLMLELDLKVEKADGEFLMELAQGIDRFQARWDLKTGTCTLVRLQDGKEEEILDQKPTNVSAPGTYQLRFANFDERLTVWVNGSLPFGDGTTWKHPWYFDQNTKEWVNIGPTENDLYRPAGFASKGANVAVSHVRLWRDTFYLTDDRHPGLPGDALSDPKQWDAIRKSPALMTMYVQPKHYLCLGDNSQASQDSRTWGLVPERLLLGRALVVYWPASRLGTIIH